MGSYEEAVQEIEAAYDKKRDTVEDKYDAKQVARYQRHAKKKWPKRGGAAIGGGVLGAGSVKFGVTALAGSVMPFFGGPLALAGCTALGVGGGYLLGGKGTDKAIDSYNRAMDGAERMEKGWYTTREAASKRKTKAVHAAGKGKTKAASWASIDRLLSDSDDD